MTITRKILIHLNTRDLNKIRPRVVVSGVILIIILSLDLHRYGAWYTGNAAYIKYHWIPVLCLPGYFVARHAAAIFVQWCVRRDLWWTLYCIGIYVWCLPFALLLANQYLFKSPVWYDPSIFRPGDRTFLLGLTILIGFPLGIILCLAILGYIYYLMLVLYNKVRQN